MVDHSSCFVNIYQNVLEKEIKKFNVRDDAIRKAIEVMKDAYSPDPHWRSKSIFDLSLTNYDNPAFRCAYLHKYAMCYTGVVCHLLQLALDQSNEIYGNFKRMERVYFCSLGGGPGTDIVGVLAALASRNLDIDPWAATVVDLAGNWKTTFFSVLHELQSGNCILLRRISRKMFRMVNYLKTNLLGNWGSEPLTEKSIRNADVLLMVKFISAAACNFYTEKMIEKIFYYLKPGAMVLFIDNAAGGFDKVVKQKALEVGLTSIYGPLLHYEYKNSIFNIRRYGSKSQSKSKVVFEVYKKQSRYIYQEKNVDQSRINYVPEIRNRKTQYYQEISAEVNLRRVNKTKMQNTDDIRFNPWHLLMFFMYIFVFAVVIKLYIEI